MKAHDITLAGECLTLLPQKAMYWAAQEMLIVADIHFGKASAFRKLGIPVPYGTTSQNLDLLDDLLKRHPIKHMLFLGDFLHAKNTAASTLRKIIAWRAVHPSLALTLVRGNHDLRAGDPPDALQMTVVDEPYRLKDFAFCHHPAALDDAYVIAGHVHPVYRLSGRRESLRLPCFVVGLQGAILPSFGAFTGGYEITRKSNEQIYIVADDTVFHLKEGD